jgi:hypothetical protein
MSDFRPPHEMHTRRFGRNVGVGLLLAGLIGIVFALTVVKVTRGDPMQAYDHQVRPELLPVEATPKATSP